MKRRVMRIWTRALVAALSISATLENPFSLAGAEANPPTVGSPPDAFFELVSPRHRETARKFYKKHLSVNGLPVAAAEVVDDRALVQTSSIVTHMLAGRPDVLQKMVENGMYLIIIGKDQVYTDMPEYSGHPNPAYQNERVRGTGGKPTSFGEENVLGWALDRYDDESIGVHEFCHTIDGTLRSLDPEWNARKNAAYRAAMEKGLWRNSYAASNAGEFWAEIAQSYFDCNRVNNWNHGPIGTREQLKAYDPASYELVRSTFRLSPEQDWRYAPLQRQPTVGPPPAKLKIDPYYTKFTWAREFTVVGRDASDEAILKANDTIRKMFAYRHDVLKALIADGAKLVVLGRRETLADLPELRRVDSTAAGKEAFATVDRTARFLEYSPETKLIVVGEENLLSDIGEPMTGDCQVIRLMAMAMYEVTGKRPVDPNWERRGRSVQQYELRVKRLDVQFDERLKKSFEAALAKGLWKGAAAVHDPASYWAIGVTAYFDAGGQTAAPHDAKHPICTREELEQYDAELFGLVEETMAYNGHVDWRYPRGPRR
jgi:alpha-glucosidase